ncbi:TetR/AcrR family transcriptional regulator [Paenibacillus sp. CGMCC 1.16610]|uniref:TetR family transcriptional regulator n=1 Tax=Paenibacillus anseongense TaxID=2682845 RepID=A0ABW9UFP6_9BACL|nr:MULTISPECIES: TetR/AcrR family transcriptional regulator [Paenibacillus]MBA2942696.1 TetR/AcrR family transcriptional regulator [Paenibacillus sp. CGMCC 1.16610]MVQ38182.1 TetR family transcriptional regulator [Paenibacillus anseongense]
MASNKDRILEAAMDLFHDHGYQGTGLEDILSSSGVCKSNFYYHFKSKEELGLKVIERKVDEMRQSVLEPSLGNTKLSPKQRVLELFERMLSFCDENECRKGCFFGNLALELSDCSEELRKPLSRFFSEMETEIEACLKEGRRQGELSLQGLAPVELAAPIVSLWQGGMLLTKTHKDSRAMRDGIKVLTVCMG